MHGSHVDSESAFLKHVNKCIPSNKIVLSSCPLACIPLTTFEISLSVLLQTPQHPLKIKF